MLKKSPMRLAICEKTDGEDFSLPLVSDFSGVSGSFSDASLQQWK